MPTVPFVAGLPGFRSAQTATPRLVFRQGLYEYLAGGKIIDGSESRDCDNTGNIDRLRCGLLMGMITSTGLWAPSIVGVLGSAYTSGGTSLTVSAAVATELARLVGQSGTAELVAIGPPTANGTLAITDITHSAIGATTLTVSSLGVDKVAGTLIAVKDGRQLPRTLIGDDFPVAVTDGDGASIDVPFARFPIAGVIMSENLLPVWPSDTSIRTWIRESLSTLSQGKFIFDDLYQI